MISARPYQTEAIRAVEREFESNQSTLISMATGCGKTIIFAQIAKSFIPLGKVLVLAHREELIYQASRKLHAVTGLVPGIEMSDEHITHDPLLQPDIIVSTIQTQISGMAGKGRMAKFNPDEFSLVIVDEAHHTAAKSYVRVLDYYKQNPKVKILGVTATPDRADEKALGKIFETVAFEYDILSGVKDGWLVPVHQRLVLCDGLDFSSVRTTAGDLNGADLSKIMEEEKALHMIAGPAIELCGEKKSLVFTASVHQADRLCEIFNRHKSGCARFVHAKTERQERQSIFSGYAAKEFQFLCNCGITTEGFDDPGIEIVVMARPTKSRSLYAQMCGRGTRPLPGVVDSDECGWDDPDMAADARRYAIQRSEKPHIEIIDFVGNSGRHKLMTTIDILGGDYSDETIAAVKEKIEKGGRASDTVSLLGETEQELEDARLEAERRRKEFEAARYRLTAKANYKTRVVDPFDVFCIAPHREKGWFSGKPASQKQIDLLERFGIPNHSKNPVTGTLDPLSFSKASQLIENLIKRRKEGLCTYKQARVLRNNGVNPNGITFEKASEMITELAKTWKRSPEPCQT